MTAEPTTSETVTQRLDREVKRLTDLDPDVRPSLSYIDGVEHAADLASRMPASLDRAEVVAALVEGYSPKHRTDAPQVVMGYQNALSDVADRLGIDLDAELAKENDK